MKRLTILLITALLLCSCTTQRKAAITVITSDFVRVKPDNTEDYIVLNCKTMKIHTDSSCRYVAKIAEADVRYVEKSRLDEIVAIGYECCKVCAEK